MSQNLTDALDHPTLAHIENDLLKQVAVLMEDSELTDPYHLDGFPDADTQGLIRRQLRYEAVRVAHHLAEKHQAGIEVTLVGSGSPWDMDFEGILLRCSADAGQDQLILAQHLDYIEDFTLALQAPAGPASLLACAAALQQHMDQLAADVARLEDALLRTAPDSPLACTAVLQQHTDQLTAVTERLETAVQQLIPTAPTPEDDPADHQDAVMSELGARLGNTDVYLSWDGEEDPGLLRLTLAHAGTTDPVRSWHDHLAPYVAAVNGTTTESHLKSFSYGPWGVDMGVHPDQDLVVVFIEDHAGDQREFELFISDLRQALINAEVPDITGNDQNTTA